MSSDTQPKYLSAIVNFVYDINGKKGKKEVGDIAPLGKTESEWIDHLKDQAIDELAEQFDVEKDVITLGYVSIDADKQV